MNGYRVSLSCQRRANAHQSSRAIYSSGAELQQAAWLGSEAGCQPWTTPSDLSAVASYSLYCEQFAPRLQILDIPTNDAATYSIKLLKWLRYVMSCALGTQGSLVKHPEDGGGPSVNLESVDTIGLKLNFVPDGQVQLVDLEGLNHLTSSRLSTDSCLGFDEAVKERDGGCVITGRTMFADGVHLLPHSKGSEVCLFPVRSLNSLLREMQYIAAVFRLISSEGEPQIDCIDDVRNGILLALEVHRLFGQCGVGFLPMSPFFLSVTPGSNIIPKRVLIFALSVDEVLPAPSRQNESRHFTPHSFFPASMGRQDRDAFNQYKSDILYPKELREDWPMDWPPAFLWDFIYGIVVSKAYCKYTSDLSKLSAAEGYYREGVKTASDRQMDQIIREQQEKEATPSQQREATERRAGTRGGRTRDKSGFTVAGDMVLNFWIRSYYDTLTQKVRAEKIEEHKKCEQEVQELTSERVDMWRKNVEDPAV